jgi:type VI secretion system protein ImpL
MLDMDSGGASKVSLNGPLVEHAQATLARMRVSERAYTLLKSEAHNLGIEDWAASQRGGPDTALVFEAANGASLDTVRVPGFLTYEGFYAALLDRMPTIADKLQKENWVLGASGDQGAVKQQYASLFPDILDLYGKDFLSAWTAALNNLQLRPLLRDKPKYVRLSAASAPTSPIRQIFESVRDETTLTRERPKPPQAGEAADQAKKDAVSAASSRLGSAGREAVDLAMKSQRKAGDPPGEVPGASIEANFRPYQILVDGQPGSRPIDALLANLNELYHQLVLAADNPAQAKQALDQVEVQVASLRSNVTRLPQPLSGMMDKVAKDAAGDATATSVAQLSDSMAQDVTGTCQQIIANRYPFAKSDRDLPIADFARLFAPGGAIDRFFSANLEPLVNRNGKSWTWKSNPNLTRKLSDTTLREFQEAAEIRDAFFPTGGNAPNVSLEVKPLTLSADAQTATLSINGANVVAQQGVNAATNIQWPGAGAGDASIVSGPRHARPQVQPGAQWSMGALQSHRRGFAPDSKRQLDQGQFRCRRTRGVLSVRSASLVNPLSMPSLRQFKCPNGL